MIMKKMLVVAAAFIVQLCALADNPLWMKYDKPLTVKGARLAGELKELFVLSHVQEEEIRMQLGSIGIEK